MNLTKILAALTSFLTVIAALPYELGEVATLFPPEWKVRIAVAGALATAILRILGNVPAKPADKPPGKNLPLLLLLLLPAFALTGCVIRAHTVHITAAPATTIKLTGLPVPLP